MALFSPKKKNIIGLDVGAGGLKLVEFGAEHGRARLHTYAFTERSAQGIEQSLLDDTKATAELVKKMMKEAKTTTTRVVAGLPIASVFSSIISVPATTSSKELKEAIEWQAKKLIPLPLEEMVLDWKMLGEEKKPSSARGRGLMEQKEVSQFITGKPREGPPELGRKTVRVLLTGAAKALVAKYAELTKAAGLELVALETEAFALIRSLIGKDPSTIMLVDFGTLRTSLVIVKHGVPVLTRTINLGGVTMTRTMARTLGLPDDQAEQMKRDIHKLAGATGGGATGMPALLAKTLEPLITEINYSLNLYKTQQGEPAELVEKVILTGGSAHLPYLAAHISKQININAYVGDPWARVATHEDLRGVLDEVGPRFAVAIGLAMRDFE
ncbi:pilus assembly protein PilM [Candidatus Uhrbacteria bacterium]|nr:pilus assembly protein PilM [Candidatus Uhrbacteria bacterium]